MDIIKIFIGSIVILLFYLKQNKHLLNTYNRMNLFLLFLIISIEGIIFYFNFYFYYQFLILNEYFKYYYLITENFILKQRIKLNNYYNKLQIF
jgi:hypothetical protein